MFLVALGIDDNIFLMTQVCEEANRRDARHGALAGSPPGRRLVSRCARLTSLPARSLMCAAQAFA